MKMYDVYPVFDVEPIKGEGCYITDDAGRTYLDLYGGHAVISVGHSHPYFVAEVQEQTSKMIFYSNSVKIGLQEKLAQKIGHLSGYDAYDLFLVNSGAEAVENALKLSSFHNGRDKVLAIRNGFHGRTSAAVNCTDNEKIKAKINTSYTCDFIEMNDLANAQKCLATKEYTCVIIEPIQGVGGLDEATNDFLIGVENSCKATDTVFIIDEIQSGCGRSGKYFAHQYAGVTPHIITMAKGIGNGFPIGGLLIDGDMFPASYGKLGTTFGGNHLACAASLAVHEILEKENLMKNVIHVSNYLREKFSEIPVIKKVKGKGLMLGIEFDFPIKELRESLVYEHAVFTGSSKNPNLLRLLPPLTITEKEVDIFIWKLELALSKNVVS